MGEQGGGPAVGLSPGNPDPTSCARLLTSPPLRFQGCERSRLGHKCMCIALRGKPQKALVYRCLRYMIDARIRQDQRLLLAFLWRYYLQRKQLASRNRAVFARLRGAGVLGAPATQRARRPARTSSAGTHLLAPWSPPGPRLSRASGAGAVGGRQDGPAQGSLVLLPEHPCLWPFS